MAAAEKTLPLPAIKTRRKTIHEWTSLDHHEECPRHRAYDERKLAALVREQLRLDAKAKLPDRSKWPPVPCSEVEGVCCPADIIVNASNRPIIIGATGVPEVARDKARIDPGDRRQNAYYVEQIGLPLALGIQRVRDLPIRRLVELEKNRQVRTGERPPDWVLIARKRAAEGKGPPVFDDKNSALSALQAASGEQYRGAFGPDIFGQKA